MNGGNLSADTSSENQTYTESLLNGATPKLSDDLIPIVFDGSTIKYADVKEKWYSYSDKEWANAVILLDTASEYKPGDIITKTDIGKYFVWIPRYKYKLFNTTDFVAVAGSEYVEKSQTIDIVFESSKVAASNGTKNGEWLTHPAFTSFDVDGIWASKYTIIDSSTIDVIFTKAYNYNRDLDSHMLKNMEWGAFTYLTYSNYGLKELIKDTNVSTTGNDTGLYQVGGIASNVSSYYQGYGTWQASYDSKYFDLYVDDNKGYFGDGTYQNYLLGDATKELGPIYGSSNSAYSSWFKAPASLVYGSSPWVLRGSTSNLFFHRGIGSGNYRIALSVK